MGDLTKRKSDNENRGPPRFDFIDKGVEADHLKETSRKFKWKNHNERRVLHFEAMKAKIDSVVPVPGDISLVNRTAIKQYCHAYGIRMNAMIPDMIHHIVIKLLNEGMSRIYALPTKEKRITIYPRDLPLVLL